MSKDDAPKLMKWRGKSMFRCRLCSFDSLDKQKFEDHFAKVHAPFRVIEGGKVEAEQPKHVKSKEVNNGNAGN